MPAPLQTKQTAVQARVTAAKIMVKHGAMPGTFKAQVEALFDHSGSTEFEMRRFYTKGYITGVAQTVLGLALNLDDNGTVPTYAFATDAHELPELNAQNLDDYVARNLTPLARRGGGTNLATGMRAAMKGFDRKSKDVGLCFVFTDGEANDANDVRRVLTDFSSNPVFWQFIGIHVPGDRPDFGLLEDLDSLRGRVIDNANFFEADVTQITPETILDQILREFKGYPALVAANSSRVHW